MAAIRNSPAPYIRVTRQEDGKTARYELMIDDLKVYEFRSRGELADFVMQSVSSLRW